MTISRRTTLKLGLGAGVLPLLGMAAGSANAKSVPVIADDAGHRPRCTPLPIAAVRLTGGPLKHAQDLDRRYLLELEPDRMLAFYRERAGLSRRAEPYGGWDGAGRNLTGHIAGHYLSAVSLMWAATGEDAFRRRAHYLVGELKLVQDAHGDGYLVALEGGREAFARLSRGDIVSTSFDLNGLWAPWYTLHKTFAGLRDAWRYTGNQTALEMEVAFAAWAEGVLADLDSNQLQHMMNTEIGGMNEVLVDLYADTGDERWLWLSRKFEHDDFIAPLRAHEDNLAGKHGNTAVPKLIGSADRYAVSGDPQDLIAAAFFWDTVVRQHTFATGGHGKDEYFGPAGALSARVDGRTAETCNIYNMLKLTRRLFAVAPDARLADFQERALFNHILGSMHPDDGRTCYMVPVGRGVQREYQDMFESFTCCVGSGMESHALHGDGLYFEDGDRLYVNLYAPSTADWTHAGAALTMETDFPLGESATLRLDLAAPRVLTISLRRPQWTGDGFAVRVNDQVHELDTVPAEPWRDYRSQYRQPAAVGSAYVDVTREWRSGDVVEIRLPKSLWLEPTPDNPGRTAIMWGPLVLAGDLGPGSTGDDREADADRTPPPPVPVLVAADKPVDEWLHPVGETAGEFRADGIAYLPLPKDTPANVRFAPFYRLHGRSYAAYWDVYSDEGWQAQKLRYAKEDARMQQLEAATVAHVEPGVAASEKAFDFRGGEDADRYFIQGRPSRWGRSWFSYVVPVDDRESLVLILGLYSDDRRHTPAEFSIVLDGQILVRHQQDRTEPPRFYDAEFPIDDSLVRGKKQVTIRFEAGPDSQVPAIFDIRVVRRPAADTRTA